MPSGPLTLLRRLFRFRLRTLLLAVLVISVALGVYVNRVREQQAAIAAIQKRGGFEYYDYETDDGQFRFDGASWVPAWLRKKLGDDYFHSVVQLNLDLPSDLPADHPQSAVLADELLSHLDGLPRLESLNMGERPASNQGLVYVGRLRHLRSLSMWDAHNVTDIGFAQLSGCSRLEYLDLRGSQIGDEGLRAISQLPGLKTLFFWDLRCTDRGLAHIGRMRQLTALVLDYSVVTDNGLAHLANLHELEYLSLIDTQVTDAGIQHLRGLKSLRQLDVRGTAVTDGPRLYATLPDCLIHCRYPDSTP